MKPMHIDCPFCGIDCEVTTLIAECPFCGEVFLAKRYDWSKVREEAEKRYPNPRKGYNPSA